MDEGGRRVAERRQRLRERLRAKWIAGAEQEWRRLTGRAMTTAELERVIWRSPGDVQGDDDLAALTDATVC